METPEHKIVISIANQTLSLYVGQAVLTCYPISTAKNGVGELFGSECTPSGKHYVRAKIGADLECGSVLIGRRFTGEIYSSELAEKEPERDWILSRILWLSGLEKGFNRLGKVDTMRRYIYIHGSPDGAIRGQPESHGCIRMTNNDVIDLFEKVDVGIEVLIETQTQ